MVEIPLFFLIFETEEEWEDEEVSAKHLARPSATDCLSVTRRSSTRR